VTARGEQTRARILDAAERLFADRGADNVSLREIRLASGQSNNSALHFHFGDRDGLLLALAQRHLPRVAAIQERLYAEVIAAGRRHDPAALVEVLVRPTVEYLRRGPGERAWVQIAAEQSARPERKLAEFIEHAPAVSLTVGVDLQEILARSMSRSAALERLLSMGRITMHLCADRARLIDARPERSGTGQSRPMLADDTWGHDVVAMIVGAVLAPAPANRRTPAR
jgi:AcrR family transcriptional regulator